MGNLRISLSEQLETRDGTSNKDELPTNCFVDGTPDRKKVTKRFGTALSVALGAGQGQGMFSLGTENYAIKGDSIYRLSDSHNFTYTAPSTLNLQYQSITQPDNTKAIFKNTKSGYIFDGTTVSQIAGNGGVSSITITNAGWGGAVSPPTMSWNTPTTSTITGSFTATNTNGIGNGIAWNGSVFCAVGSSGASTNICYTSPDGVTWTARTMSASSPYWAAIAWNGTVFCAIGATNTTGDTNVSVTSPDGINWTTRTLPTSAEWKSVVSHSGLFVAIGYSYTGAVGKIITSPDGITWTSRTLPAAMTKTNPMLATNGSIVVCIFASDSILWKSTDGITWTTGTYSSPVGSTTVAIAWNGSVFCAITNNSSTSATSPDGITWTGRTLPASLLWTSITSVNGVFVAVASNSNNTYISNDGINWTVVTISGAAGTWESVGTNGTKAVVIDKSATSLIANSTVPNPYGGTYNLIFTGGSGAGAAGTFTVSPIGVSNTIAFTTRTLPSSAAWSAVAFSSTLGTGAGRFCAIAGVYPASVTTAATSDDGGLTWTARTLPVAASWSSIVWNGSIFCAIADVGTIAATSPDGITWTQRTVPYHFNTGLVWNGSKFLMTGQSAATGGVGGSATSPDGITWTPQSIPSFATLGIRYVSWNGSIFCYVGSEFSKSFTSVDGINWVQHPFPSPANSAGSALTTNGTIFCAVMYNSNSAFTSPDGISWTQQTLPATTQWNSITWNGALFCAVSSFAGLAATSPDGITWTQTSASTTEQWVALASNTATGLIVGVASGTSHAMTGIAGVSSGGVISTTITNPGSGYSTIPPTVSFANATGLTGATGIANVSFYPVTTVPGVAYLNGTYYVMEAVTNRIYGSGVVNAVLDNPAVWTPLNYVTANSVSGTGVAIARYFNYIVAFKSESIEFFYDAGGALPSSPLASVTNASSRVGCASSVIVPIDNTLVFLSKSLQKGIQVSMLEGNGSIVISTPDVDRLLNATNILASPIYAFAIKIQGHSFYFLSLKGPNITLAYDMVTKGWFKVTYLTLSTPKSVTSLTYSNGLATATVAAHGYSDGDPIVIAGAVQTAYNGTFNITYVDANTFTYTVSGSPVTPATGTITATGYTEGFFPVSNYLNSGTLDLLQHETDGDIYYASPFVYQDQGSPINVKIRTNLHDLGNTESKCIPKIELIGDKVSSTALIRYSDDDYQTYSKYRPVDMSAKRSMITRCGSMLRRAFEVKHTDNTAFRVESLQLDIDS